MLRLIKFSLCTVRLCTSLLLGFEHTRFPNEAHTATSSRPFGWTGNYTAAILSLQVADYKSRNSSACIHVNQFLKKQSFSLSSACPLFCVVCVYVCPVYSQRHLSRWFHILVILTNHPLQSCNQLKTFREKTGALEEKEILSPDHLSNQYCSNNSCWNFQPVCFPWRFRTS